MALRPTRPGSTQPSTRATDPTPPADIPGNVEEARRRFVPDEARAASLIGAREVAQSFPVAGPFQAGNVPQSDLVSMDTLRGELEHFRELPEESQRLALFMDFWGLINQQKFGRNPGGSDPKSGA